MREIKLDNWIAEGHGFTADSYRNAFDESLLLKLFFTENGRELAETEFFVANEIKKMRIPTPRVYEIVKAEGKIGVIYERVMNKKSFGVLCSEDPENIQYYAEVFAEYSKNLHSTKCDKEAFPDRTIYLRSVIDKVEIRDEIRIYLHGLIDALGEADTCVHGDLQTGNLVMGWCEGVEGHKQASDEKAKAYFIDLSTFSYGDPVLDVAELYLSCKIYDKVESNINLLHMDTEILHKFWYYYVRKYLGTGDPAAVEKFERYVEPYAIFFLLCIIDAADGYEPVINIAMEHIEGLYRKCCIK